MLQIFELTYKGHFGLISKIPLGCMSWGPTRDVWKFSHCPRSLKSVLILLSFFAVFVGQVLFVFKPAAFSFILKKTHTGRVCDTPIKERNGDPAFLQMLLL